MTVSVYVKKISDVKVAHLSSEARRLEIDGVKNEGVKREKCAVWKLLEDSVQAHFGVSPKDVSFRKSESGKWKCDICEFSLSHSRDLVAVAISDEPVGVDIELYDERKLLRIASRLLTGDELKELDALSEEKKGEYIIKAWTGKEAAFKIMGEGALLPKKEARKEEYIYRRKIELDGDIYFLAVATKKEREIAVNII